MNRTDKLTASIKLHGKGLEIGPLCWPILRRPEAHIAYVDHASTEELRALYKDDPGVPPHEIVDIDYPLHGRSLKETVGQQKRFDYILASHVIEHVPDMIGWLDDMASVLKPRGVLSLAIPDKRFTFDIDRNVSRPADVIGAHLDRRTKPSAVTVFDYMSNYRAKVDPKQAWEGQLYTSEDAGPHRYNLAEAQKYSLINRDTDEYVDTHCFVYTPASFIHILQAMATLKLLPFKVINFYETSVNEYEFFVSLEKILPNETDQIITSLPELGMPPTERELQAQIDTLHDYINGLHTAHDEVLSSLSWKVTTSLRTINKYIKRRG